MSELPNKDWERINAYHDREMGAEEARDLEVRLASEPALAEALEEVRRVSAAMVAMRSELATSSSRREPRAANTGRRPVGWLAGGAIAAAIAVAVAMRAGFVAAPTPLDIHTEYADQVFEVGAGDLRPVSAAGLGAVPDLSDANLAPVAFRRWDGGAVTHYAGRNGCRLTYFRGTFETPRNDRATEHQVASWTSRDGARHMVVANGMDPARFDAIADYLELATGQRATESVIASLQGGTRACIG